MSEATCRAAGCERVPERPRPGGRCERCYRAELAARPMPPCTTDGCDLLQHRKGMCSPHYHRRKKANRQYKPCTVPGCTKQLESNGLCGMHNQRLANTGSLHRDPEPPPDTVPRTEFSDDPPMPPMPLFKCRACGVTFQRQRGEARKAIKHGSDGPFCSRQCSSGARKLAADPCPASEPLSPADLITDETIRTETNRRRYYDEGLEPTTWCAGCAKWIGHGPGRTCRDCYMAARATTRVTRTCVTCGSEFQLMRAEDAKKERAGQVNRYCSRACVVAGLRTGTPCEACGTIMTSANGRRFCSEECRRPSRTRARRRSGQRVLDPCMCSTCGRVFRPKSSRRQYCSRECAADAHSTRMVGGGNSHFKDGTSYAEWFKQMRPLIIERDGCCRGCGEIKPDKLVWRRDRDKPQVRSQMVVHHIDERPWRNEPKNLIYLCHSCHMTHHKSTTDLYPWFEGYAFDATLGMPDEWHDAVSTLAEKYASAAELVQA